MCTLKSLWIKASAECINVNVKTLHNSYLEGLIQAEWAILSGSGIYDVIYDVMMCNSSLFVSHSFPKRWTKGRCWAAHLCLFNPRQGDVLCVELRVMQRFLSIIHRAAAASVLLFNSPADHIIPSPQPKAICETRALQGNSIKAPTNISAFCFQSYSWWKKDAFDCVQKNHLTGNLAAFHQCIFKE